VYRRTLSFEFIMWAFMRLSGAALFILGIIGMAGALYMGARTQMDLPTLMRWTFFPNPNHVVNSNIADVNLGWVSVYWQVTQLLMVFFGATHGFNGLRVVMEDYVPREGLRKALRWVIVLLWATVLLAGAFIIFSA
jgi:succinate dehydrogenase / fumarate reductase membrane anchor subunit